MTKKRAKFVPASLEIKAAASVQKQVEKELAVEDPTPEQAKAVLQGDNDEDTNKDECSGSCSGNQCGN